MSDKPVNTESPQPKPTNATTSDDDIFSDASGGRKKFSASSKQSRNSYDFKQTVENLHHGLPAHASQESVQNEVAPKPEVKDSVADDVSFGSYKPTLGRRAAAKRDNSKEKDDVSFGSYNPSFGAKKDTTRKSSGLDFGAGKKNSSEKEQNFGDYNPSFGAASNKASSSQPNGDIVGGRTSPARGRRGKVSQEAVKPTGNPLFGDSSSINKDKSSYPWENKVNVGRRSSQPRAQEDSLLPRRKRLQSIGKSTETNVRAVDNALDDVDDDIEEVIL
ncbi:Lebercilin [Desmophyllum pertusum]|uniref:Lebercilin n=1 Tax=Desmophyllum pertusum TaxID=174260 RepID=A0A9W9ZQ01_9CNID|nr:Lebercilin [Desmophyllum pertusum]